MKEIPCKKCGTVGGWCKGCGRGEDCDCPVTFDGPEWIRCTDCHGEGFLPEGEQPGEQSKKVGYYERALEAKRAGLDVKVPASG